MTYLVYRNSDKKLLNSSPVSNLTIFLPFFSSPLDKYYNAIFTCISCIIRHIYAIVKIISAKIVIIIVCYTHYR